MSVTALAAKHARGRVMLSISITRSTFRGWFMWQLEPKASGCLPELNIPGHNRGRRIRVAPFPKGTHAARWILEGWLKSSDTPHFAFLSVTVISCHYARFPLTCSYPWATKASVSLLPPCPATTLGHAHWQQRGSDAPHTSSPGSPASEECGLLRRLKGLGKCSPAVSCQHSSPSAFPKVSGRKSFFVLISSNKNNEFFKPARMWQGANKGNQEGDVWSIGCSSNKSLHKPVLQGGNSNSLEPLFLVLPFRFSPAKYPK